MIQLLSQFENVRGGGENSKTLEEMPYYQIFGEKCWVQVLGMKACIVMEGVWGFRTT